MMNPYVKEILDDQSRKLENAKEMCIETFGNKSLFEVMKPSLYNATTKSFMCPAYWDGILCWPDSPPNSLVSKSCPSYITGFLPLHNATRKCMENGVWFIQKTQNSSWTNYTNCYLDEKTTILVDIHKSNIPKLLQTYLPLIKVISQTGYAISLVTLIVAFFIMVFIKKLHCARNILHMHLFASFILRAFIFIFKDLTFIEGVGLATDMANQNGSLYFNIDSETNNWECKFLTSLWQYFITANYSWILMEGLYLHNLIFRAMFADSNKSIRWYIILGWGLPLIVISKWIIARLLIEDTFCWTTHESYKVFLIIAVPTMISVLINLLLFVRISLVLYNKLHSPINDDSHRYKKWAKSTLVLMPLFGVHYAVFLGLYSTIKTNRIVELIWLICDRLFGSFQGFFVAVLYCFLNSEVKAELKPQILNFLTYLATSNWFKMCFPCRNMYLRSAVGRTSVCTTMSCSSLYNNGIINRTNKCRWDHINRKLDKRDHACQNGMNWQDMSRRNGKYNQSGHQILSHPINITATESTLSIEHAQKTGNSAEHTDEEIVRIVDGNTGENLN